MNLDTRHPIGDGCRLVVGEPRAGDADQDYPAREALGGRLPRQHVGGRNEAVVFVGTVVDPKGSIALGRHAQITESYRADAVGPHLHRDGRPTVRDAQELE